MRTMVRISEPAFLGNEEAYVADAMARRQLSRGDYARRLEEEFARLAGTRHAVAVSSGTAALHAMLEAVGAGPGDRVAVPATTYIATANAVAYTGATPVPVDVSPVTWTIDWAAAEAAGCGIAIAVHLYGAPAMEHAGDFAGVILEDAAEAAGATWGARRVGSLGAAAAFSLYASKTLAAGEGGVVTTDDAALADEARLVAGVGQGPERYVHVRLGWNYRITELAAAVALAQAERAVEHLARRAALRARYDDRLAGVQGLGFQGRPPGSADWVMPVLVPDRRLAEQALRLAGVETRPVFPPIHRQPIYEAAHDGEPLPIAEHLGRHGLLLPLHPGMTGADVDRVCDALVPAVAGAACL